MIRRFVPAAALALGLCLTATGAHALSLRTKECIAATRTERRTCVTQCTETSRNRYASCFGPGAACAAACIGEQSTCQTDPANAQIECGRNCNTALRSALALCVDQPDPVACADNARLDGLKCTQACALAAAPALQICSRNFSECVETCASQR
jgi:hypothetical protein